MNKKYIFIDIDGTLFDHATRTIPSSAIHAIEQAHKNGHKIYLSTGRSNTEIDQLYESIPISGMILSCGAQVIWKKSQIFLAKYPHEELMSLISFMLKHNIGFSLDGTKRSFFSDEAFCIFSNLMLKNANHNTELARAKMAKNNMYHLDQLTEADFRQILKISLFSKNLTSCQKLMKNIPTSLQGFIYKNPNYDLINGEISIKGVNKATGIDKILEKEKASLQDTIAIGDSLNDLEMIEHASIGICMGNGVDQLKQAADYVTKSISDDGLEHAFRHFNLI